MMAMQGTGDADGRSEGNRHRVLLRGDQSGGERSTSDLPAHMGGFDQAILLAIHLRGRARMLRRVGGDAASEGRAIAVR